MARIVAGVGISHIASIGVAADNGLEEDSNYKPVVDGCTPAREWIKAIAPDVVILIYNDHVPDVSDEVIKTFALGVADSYVAHDHMDGASRNVPDVLGDGDFAAQILESLILDEFDMARTHKMTVDHRLSLPLTIMFDHPDDWPVKVIPLSVNVTSYPQPTGNRCFKLGKAIGKAVESYPEDLRVAVFGTGGMSHQRQGEKAGSVNTEFDTMFLDHLCNSPESLVELNHNDYIRDAGSESIGLIMWLMMRGALKSPLEAYRFYHAAMSNPAAGLVCYEESA